MHCKKNRSATVMNEFMLIHTYCFCQQKWVFKYLTPTLYFWKLVSLPKIRSIYFQNSIFFSCVIIIKEAVFLIHFCHSVYLKKIELRKLFEIIFKKKICLDNGKHKTQPKNFLPKNLRKKFSSLLRVSSNIIF